MQLVRKNQISSTHYKKIEYQEIEYLLFYKIFSIGISIIIIAYSHIYHIYRTYGIQQCLAQLTNAFLCMSRGIFVICEKSLEILQNTKCHLYN